MARRVLIEIGHPAHVHFFKGIYRRLVASGAQCQVVTRNKEITDALLTSEGIPFRSLSTPASNLLGKASELLVRWFKIGRCIHEFKPHLSVSISGISTAPPSRVNGVRTLTLTDTEDARVTNALAFPFSDTVLTPQYYLGDLGHKHRRYDGLHELVYLQNFEMEPEAAPEIFVRLVANDALHDLSLHSKTTEILDALVSRFNGQLKLSCQGEVPEVYEPFCFRGSISEVHRQMAKSLAFIGDSPTMAVESALLGVPAFLVTKRWPQLGNMQGLVREGLLLCFAEWNELFEFLKTRPDFTELRRIQQCRAAAYRSRLPNVEDRIFQVIHEELERCAP